MAKQPEDLVVRILRDIQHTLADHSRQFGEIRQQFVHVDRRFDELNDGMITSLGLASHAHVRQDGIQKEIDNLKKRIKRLEEKR